MEENYMDFEQRKQLTDQKEVLETYAAAVVA